MDHTEKIAEMLNKLLKKNYDAQKGYADAAEKAHSADLKRFFAEREEERKSFGRQLKAEITNFGMDPEDGSEFQADIHRAWMDLRASLSSAKEEVLLQEVERGEKAAVKDYEEVLKNHEIPPSTANLLLRQKNAIVETINKLKRLEHST